MKQHPNASHEGYFSENCYLTSYFSSFGTKILIGFEKFSIKTTHLVPRYLLKICGKINPPTSYAFRYLKGHNRLFFYYQYLLGCLLVTRIDANYFSISIIYRSFRAEKNKKWLPQFISEFLLKAHSRRRFKYLLIISMRFILLFNLLYLLPWQHVLSIQLK